MGATDSSASSSCRTSPGAKAKSPAQEQSNVTQSCCFAARPLWVGVYMLYLAIRAQLSAQLLTTQQVKQFEPGFLALRDGRLTVAAQIYPSDSSLENAKVVCRHV